jgi:2-hydroxychromene-2-carboxylate isomerase
MTTIEVYFDFRSPYAYFAAHRIRRGLPRADITFAWRPVAIDVLLNLQAGGEAFAPYVDPLSAPKRAHLIADVRRLASYYDLPLKPTRPPRPNSIPALCLATLLPEGQRAQFVCAVFDALWQKQQDIADAAVLARCLTQAGGPADTLMRSFEVAARAELADRTEQAYARGVFGVPTFVCGDEIFFGNDRLDLLLWTLEQRRVAKSSQGRLRT